MNEFPFEKEYLTTDINEIGGSLWKITEFVEALSDFGYPEGFSEENSVLKFDAENQMVVLINEKEEVALLTPEEEQEVIEPYYVTSFGSHGFLKDLFPLYLHRRLKKESEYTEMEQTLGIWRRPRDSISSFSYRFLLDSLEEWTDVSSDAVYPDLALLPLFEKDEEETPFGILLQLGKPLDCLMKTYTEDSSLLELLSLAKEQGYNRIALFER